MATPKAPLANATSAVLQRMLGGNVEPAVLAAEFNDLLRNRPTLQEVADGTDEALAWVGRINATVQAWNAGEATIFSTIELELNGPPFVRESERAYRRLIALLHKALASLRLEIVPPEGFALEPGKVFDYFDGLRKIIERASSDLLFVDPYLDADFVARYLPYTPAGVPIRLLTKYKLSTLLPAVDAFVAQHKIPVQVRSVNELHDRYLFVDRLQCFQSGASFKDGAAKAPTSVTQITDAFAAMLKTYEDIWVGAKVER